MSEDFATFDLAEMLAGKTHPREVVSVWFNEELGYAITKTTDLLRRLPVGDPDVKKVQKELDELIEAGKAQEFKVHLRGSDRQERQDILDTVLAEFPQETDLIGRPRPNKEGNKKHANLYWLLHIEKIEAPDGRINVPDEATIDLFRGKAPDSAVNEVERGIEALVKKTTDGFDSLRADLSFFAEPSPEG